MDETQPNIYDRVSYPTSAHTATHPDRLAVMAALFGMTPAPVEHCRVLELGCNDGWNLIPMAFGLPRSEFLGVDLAAQPIARGRAAIGELKLGNIRLEQADLMEFPAEFGQFDYIVAHGVYSWVPEPVRDKLLAVVRTHMTPNGVAFISYNANPAGRIRQMLREIMLFHAGAIEDPVERVVQGVALLQFIAGSRTGPDPYLAVVRAEAERMAQSQPQAIFHDELEENYWPVYFHEFAAHAAAHGLQYLSEAALGDMQATGISTEKYQQLRELARGDVVAHEQYMDFAKFRKFRQTLLCHAERPLSRVPDTQRLHGLFVASPARRTEPDPRAGEGVERFECPTGDTASTNNPLAKAVLGRLIAAWPRVERFEALLDLAPESSVGGLLLQLHAGGMIEFHSYDPRMAADPGRRPEASRLARFQSADSNVVITLHHKHGLIDDDSAVRLLRLLDGTRDREALLREMAALQPDVPIESLRVQTEQNLARFARLGLLHDNRGDAP